MPDTLRRLVNQGADVFRLNMSHAEHAWVRKVVPRIRAAADEADRAVAILHHTQAPETRKDD